MSVTLDRTEISVSIETDGKDVIANGSVIAVGDYVTFSIQDLELRLEFIDDSSNEQFIESEVDGACMILKLKNFNKPLGSGVTEPIKLGMMKGREYFFTFNVSKIQKSKVRTVGYTFYLGAETNEQ